MNRKYQRSQFKKTKYRSEYIKYNNKGFEIEWGLYGEHRAVPLKGGHGDTWDYSKLDCVFFYKYDSLDNKLFEYVYYYKNNKIDYLGYYSEFKYDSENKLLKEIEYAADSSITNSITYQYDNAQNLIRKTESRLENPDKTIICSKIFNYDSLHRITSMRSYKDSSLSYREVYIYNDNQDLKTTLRYDTESDSSLWSITKIYYTNSGKVSESYWTVVDSKTEKREVYKYNRKGLLEFIYVYDGNILTGYTRYKYKFYQ